MRSTDSESAYDKFEKEELDKFIWKQATNNPSEEGWGIASASRIEVVTQKAKLIHKVKHAA